MIFIEHASFNQTTIRDNFGAPEYSYLFVRDAFRDVLDRLGRRVDVADPEREVDAIHRWASENGEGCVFLSFNPPQKAVVGLSCPTIPVFAWEYDTIPDEIWNDNPRNDWRTVLSRTGIAITLSRESSRAVRRSLGEDFPVWPIPAPLFDLYSGKSADARGWQTPFELTIEGGLVISAGDIDLSGFHPSRPAAEGIRALRVLERAASERKAPPTLRLEGVIYTAVLCPGDGRKNWRDLVSGFVWAFRKTPTATLLFKLTHSNVEDGLMPVLRHISSLGPFDCRVILINAFLSGDAYAALIDATSYAVNTALAEGQCLPLTEYMSAGRPAVAPAHSAMLDYVSVENSFVVRSEERPAAWPQDERMAMRCRHHLISFADLVKQYRDSYRVARDEPARYERMSSAAVGSMRDFCSNDVVATRLGEVIAYLGSHRPGARAAG